MFRIPTQDEINKSIENTAHDILFHTDEFRPNSTELAAALGSNRAVRASVNSALDQMLNAEPGEAAAALFALVQFGYALRDSIGGGVEGDRGNEIDDITYDEMSDELERELRSVFGRTEGRD